MTTTPRRCARVRARLDALEADELGRLRRRGVARHLRRCAGCTAEAELQRALRADLEDLAALDDAQLSDVTPPPELLDDLLAQLREPDLRARVAGPARGAVSGARPGLTAALVLLVVALSGTAVWLGWRLGRAWSTTERGIDQPH